MRSGSLLPPVFVLALAAQVSAGQHWFFSRQENNCSNVHIISARASNEAPGVGSIGNRLGNAIIANNSGATMEALNYPATLSDYSNSSANGSAEMKSRLSSYTSACPKAKLVLIGYSQGAQVIGDALCGGGDPSELLGPYTPRVDTNAGDKVVAIIQMGDPRFVPGLSYDVGTSTRNGLFPRTYTSSNESCSDYASRIQSYCDEGDNFCATGVDPSVHGTYLDKYGTQALDFVDKKIQSSTTSSSPSASSSHKSSSVVSTELPSPLMLVMPIGIALATMLARLL